MKRGVLVGLAVLAVVACRTTATVRGQEGAVPAPSPVAPIVQASPTPLPSPGQPEPFIEYVGVSGSSCFTPVNRYPLPKGAPACQSDPNKNPWVPPKPTQPICVLWDGQSGPLPSPYVYCQPPH